VLVGFREDILPILILLSRLDDIKSSKEDLENLTRLVRDMVTAMENVMGIFLDGDKKKAIDDSLAMFKNSRIITDLVKTMLPAISWNHAKMLAVHGQTLLTGGGNYWIEYVDEARDVSDL
jgi:hypothetical protein